MSNKGISRLEFLKAGALSTAALGAGALGRGLQNKKPVKSSYGDAKNVIFLVTDGMSSGTLTLADVVKQRQFGQKSHWMSLYESDREFHRGLMDMASLDAVVTDSAAAASSWGCGKRIPNGGLNWGPNREEYKTICEIFRDSGKATGLVTTTRITHATPAGFAINMPSRGMEDDIAEQYLERDVDIMMGGGDRYFSADKRPDNRDLYSEFEQKGYTVVKSKDELARATRNSKLLGIFSEHHLPYTVDWMTDSELNETVPSLAEMTQAALDRLDREENGFILQIEGGRVDHAAHGNDAGGLVYDQLAFDDAIKIVMDFTDGRDDTLVILTTDHGNANPGLVGLGSNYLDSNNFIDSLHDYRHSFEWMYSELGYHWSDDSLDNVSAKQILDLVEYATNTKITNEEAVMIKRAFQAKYKAPFRNRQSPGAVLSGVLANYNGIYFIGTNHTADYVELAAWGPGSDRIPAFVENTALFDLMVDMADVRAYAQG